LWLSVAKTSFCKSRTSLTSSRSVVCLIIFLIFLSVLSGSIFEYCTNKFRFDSLGSPARKYYWPKEQSEEQCKEQVYLSNRTTFSDMKNAAAAFDTAQISKHKEALTVKANTKSQSELAGAKRISRHLSGSVFIFEAQVLTVIAASRTPLWLLLGWGCRGQRLSRG